MEITQQIREYAEKQGLNNQEAREEGLKEKSEEFIQKGSDLYVKV